MQSVFIINYARQKAKPNVNVSLIYFSNKIKSF